MYCHIHHCHYHHCHCVPTDSKEKGGALTQEELLALTEEMKDELKDYTVDLKDQIFSYIDIGVNPVEIANTFASLKEQDTYILRTLTNKIDELNNTTNLSMFNLRARVTDLEGQSATILQDLADRTQRIEELEDNLNSLPFEDGVLADTFVTVEEQLTEEGALNLRDFNSRTILAVNTLEELLRVKATSGRVVFVKGLQSGVFVYDSSKSDIDDGGLVINGWVRQLQTPYITPEMFGCVGDGVTDDTVNFKKFGIVRHPYKKASKLYLLNAMINFEVDYNNATLDFGQSTIIGTPAIYSMLDIQVLSASIDKLHIITGNHDGGEIVNMYMQAYSYEGGECRDVIIDCKGLLENYSNVNNTRGTAGIAVNINSEYIVVNSPKVNNVHNINGPDGISSSSGVTISGFTKYGIINDPIIDGIYTSTGVDADGVVLFERKGVATTGTGLAIVNNAKFTQTCGRGIKSQCNLEVNGMTMTLKPPSKGVILEMSWRGIDAQLGNMVANNIDFDLHEDCFLEERDPTLFSISGSEDLKGISSVSNVHIRGGSKIRYLVMLSKNSTKRIYIDNITSEGVHTELMVLYPVRNNVSDVISVRNVEGSYKYNGRLIFDNVMTGTCANLYLENVPELHYKVSLTKFDKVKLITPNCSYTGVIDYADISTESIFSYRTDESTGGITYNTSTQAVPATYTRYVHYRYGDVLNFNKDASLVLGAEGLFHTVQSPTAVIVPDKP